MSNIYIPTPRRRLSETDFCKWVGQAAPGDILEYHRGFLALDVALGRLSAPEQKALRELARRAAWASDVGLVHLVQRRHGPSDFGYLAIRRPRPRVAREKVRTERSAALEPELEDAA